MNNVEIAKRIRQIIHNANYVCDDVGSIDFATNHCYTINALTELLLDIINAPKI